MAEMENYIVDFSTRCELLWNAIDEKLDFKKTKYKDLEVTAMLCIASAGMVIPLERLISKSGIFPAHHDRAKYSSDASELDKILNSKSQTVLLDWKVKGQIKYKRGEEDKSKFAHADRHLIDDRNFHFLYR